MHEDTGLYDGTARGELLIRRCDDCAHPNAPQSTTCARCGSDGLVWTPARGTGTIATWSVVYGRPRDNVAAPRSVVAVVELDEGPWLHAQIADADPGAVAIGLPVAVEFVRPDGGEAIPVFRLA